MFHAKIKSTYNYDKKKNALFGYFRAGIGKFEINALEFV